MFRLLIFVCLAHFSIADTINGRVLLNGDETLTNSLPAGSTLDLQVLDVSVADGAAHALGSLQILNVSTFPIPFNLTYTRGNSPSPNYSLSARITNNSTLLYLNKNRITVNPTENGYNTIDVPVESVH